MPSQQNDSVQRRSESLKAGDDYWNATLRDWANHWQQELRQIQILEEFGELSQQTRQQTDDNHKHLAEQMRAKMKAQVCYLIAFLFLIYCFY
jgi:hypothetical protein